jgi:hypothetical protein
MQTRFSVIIVALIVFASQAIPASGEDKIQSFVNPYGKVIFTNLVENTPRTQPSSVSGTGTIVTVAGRGGLESPSEEMSSSLGRLVDAISSTHGVDPALVRAVIKTESNFNPLAVSRKGALGLMQLIPETGRRYGVRDFFDPKQNIDGGVRYLKFLMEKFKGNLDLSLAAYNAGENLVERLGRIPRIPETMSYVQKVRAIYNKRFATAGSRGVIQPTSDPEPPKIFKLVDARGIVHFSNIEPPN